MILTLLTCSYITIVCWGWGILFFLLYKRFTGNAPILHFSLTCLTGFSFILIVAGIISLFMPLGGLFIQLIFFIPATLITLTHHRIQLISSLKEISSFNLATKLLLFSGIAVVLIMSTWKIIHPDTLGYHAQIIQWVEKYKVVPGLVNLNTRYGLQSNWFLGAALFSFKFTNSNALIYTNSAVLIWYLIFSVKHINLTLFEKRNLVKCLTWLSLLVFSFWSYTQIRLMATSASPDFCAALFIWAVLYLLFSEKKSLDEYAGLIIMLCGIAITIKLSDVPILIIAFYLSARLLSKKKIKLLFISCFLFAISLTPFLIRNAKTSGYPLFPSSLISVDASWTLNHQTTDRIATYVTAYSRSRVGYNNADIEAILRLKLQNWIPIWWRTLSTSDKFAMLVLIVSFIVGLFTIKTTFWKNAKNTIGAVTCISGIIFWFILGPDPRFGYGFIIGFVAIISESIFINNRSVVQFPQKGLYSSPIWLISLILLFYIGYRFKNFFGPNQLLKPMGVEKIKYRTVNCNGIDVNMQLSNLGCGDTKIPYAYDSCVNFIRRGEKITDGFDPR